MTRNSLARCLAAAIAAFALALPLASAPARADDDDLKKALIGVAALAVISHQVKKNRERSAPPASQSTRNQVQPVVNQNRTCRSPTWNGNVWVEASDRLRCQPTPVVCLRERWRGDFLIKFFDSTCMRREGFRLSRRY